MSPKFELSAVDAASTTPEDVVNRLTRHGGVIVRQLIPPAILQDLSQDIHPHFNQFWKTGVIFSSKSQVVPGLCAKSAAYVNTVVCNPLYSAVCDTLLTSRHTCWYGDEQCTYVAAPQVNGAVAICSAPGNEAQRLHRDDMGHHNYLSAISPEEYSVGRDTGVGVFIAATPTTRANGATRFIPGSHLWSTETPPDESLAVSAELQPGDAFFMLASSYHGGSANTTTDQNRIIYSTFMAKGFLRQEENQYLTIPQDQLKKLSPHACGRLGYAPTEPFHGWVGFADPRTALGLPTDSE
ncbi:hypothetical protein BDV28DRAFT_63464 [Aspergillus coremiiformis]|uniref:Phytanoyl-CoA dioxygenase family protein n=1 Tax=Aspergillus coremiiformis TaxID=138285 RepID=A0A5N6ZCS8_9EURO|nr:hypothetical protein BDV28DRAFT_63464 [Aspergillus coremiiformis]